MCSVHFGFLLSAALQCTPISEPALNPQLCALWQRCSFTTLTAQRHASTQRCSSPLFLTTTVSHRCAPLLSQITVRPDVDESAVRLAPEASHTVPYG